MPKFPVNSEGNILESDYRNCAYVVTAEGPEIGFLGINLKVQPPKAPEFRANDKQKSFKDAIIRFPSWHTTIPPAVRIGTVIGMLVRTLRLTSLSSDFLEEAKYLMQLFHLRGYALYEARTGVTKFLLRNMQPHFHQTVRTALDPIFNTWQNPVPITIRKLPFIRRTQNDATSTPPEALTFNAGEPRPAHQRTMSDSTSTSVFDLDADDHHPVVVDLVTPPQVNAPITVTSTATTGTQYVFDSDDDDTTQSAASTPSLPPDFDRTGETTHSSNQQPSNLTTQDHPTHQSQHESASNSSALVHLGEGNLLLAPPPPAGNGPQQQVVQVHHHYHQAAAPTSQPVVNNNVVYNKSEVVNNNNYGTVNNNHGSVNNTQFNGDTNFGQVNQTQHNVQGDLLQGTLNQQQINNNNVDQRTLQQHNQSLVVGYNSEQPDLPLQLPGPSTAIEDRRPQQMLLSKNHRIVSDQSPSNLLTAKPGEDMKAPSPTYAEAVRSNLRTPINTQATPSAPGGPQHLLLLEAPPGARFQQQQQQRPVPKTHPNNPSSKEPQHERGKRNRDNDKPDESDHCEEDAENDDLPCQSPSQDQDTSLDSDRK